jgi:hypothetical protein
LPLVPLVGSAISHVGSPWTLVEPVGLLDTYGFLLLPLVDMRTLGALVLLGVLGRFARITTRDSTEAPRIPVHEVVAAVACLLIPAAGILAGRLGAGVFSQRYGLSVVVGAVPAVLLAVWVGSRRSSVVAWVVCAFLALSFAQSTRAGLAVLGTPYPNPVAERPALTRVLTSGEEVCVSGALMYLQFWYYTPPALRVRLHYLVDPATARRLTGTDSLDNGLAALRRWSDVTAPDYDRFVSAHRRFTVYQAGSGWLLERLRESGASVRETGVETGFRIYDVVLPDSEAGAVRHDASGSPSALPAAVR